MFGTDTVATKFVLCTRTDTGKSTLAATAAGVGTAAALICDLLLTRQGRLHDGIVVTRPGARSSHPLTDLTLNRLTGRRSTSDCLHILGADAYSVVTDHLVDTGVLRFVRNGRWWASHPVVQPVDPNVAAAPAARLAVRLSRGQRMDLGDTVLVGLLAAIGIDHRLPVDDAHTARHHLARLLDTLPTPFSELFRETATAANARRTSPGRLL
ncbi:GPP34 family phosphoprotein [Actinocrispum wychmicini]|uniref:Golgi phosphoprotein 3 GPP34 n=1 Tax=Actinocrispum wychmicini TaxID=1213861 RepID=A0A4R2JXX1_9PSEU|nr:GPP34 family phosphoprotein [Actinocrispum wychmicini]TCO62216.1 Golgi phosphoprotein 3 GPP34 [Actinocrispum wychmicini]